MTKDELRHSFRRKEAEALRLAELADPSVRAEWLAHGLGPVTFSVTVEEYRAMFDDPPVVELGPGELFYKRV